MTMKESNKICPLCEEAAVQTRIMTQQFAFTENGHDVLLTADVPVEECLSCGEILVGENGEIARHEAVCNYLGRLTPKEIKSIRAKLGLSQKDFAEKANIGVASLKRWETGTKIQNASMDTLLRKMARKKSAKTREAFTPVFRTQINDRMIEKASTFQLRPRG